MINIINNNIAFIDITEPQNTITFYNKNGEILIDMSFIEDNNFFENVSKVSKKYPISERIYRNGTRINNNIYKIEAD